jgi:conjugative transfer signal peptidase TraF
MIFHLRSIILICLALGTGYALFGPADFLVNTTHSMPLGLYYRTATPIGKGSLVSYRLDVHSPAQRLGVERGYDRGGVPLLKRVVAACGDTVSVRANGVFVDGVLILNSVPETHDKQKRSLERAPLENYTLHPGEAFLVGETATSWDSRYFGTVSVTKCTAFSPVFTWR